MIVRLVLTSRPGPLFFAQAFFLVTGVVALGYTGFHVASRCAYQAHEGRAFEREVALQRTSKRSHVAVVEGSVVGKIEIPRLNISAIVREGVDERTLDIAAGHILQTALPGHTGNAGIAAHRDTLFRNLKDVQREDRLTLTTLDGEFVYRVVSYKIVQPTDVSVLEPKAGENTLTLVTCYPFYFVGHAPKRFIVHARQVL